MNPLRQKQIHDLLFMTEEILHYARSGEWDSMIKKEQERRSLIEIFFQYNSSDQDVLQVEDLVNRIISMDEKSIAIAESGKLDILKKMRNLSAGQQAIDAYASNSS